MRLSDILLLELQSIVRGFGSKVKSDVGGEVESYDDG